MKQRVSLTIVAILWMFSAILPVDNVEMDDLVFYF